MNILKIGLGRWPNAARYATFRTKSDISSTQGCGIPSFTQSKDFPNAKSPVISVVMKVSHLDYSFAR